MWRRSSRPGGGFTLVEVLVVVASLGMILWMVGALFFPMQKAAERQRLQVEARQTARGATDYVAMLVRGATDMNDITNPRNPAAILTFLVHGSVTGNSATPTCDGTPTSGCIQLSYDNVTDATLATPGTDILTFGVPSAPMRLKPSHWPSAGNFAASTNAWEFDQGCPSDAANMTAFKNATGYGSDPAHPTWSQPQMLFDKTGNWVFYQITDYKESPNSTNCSDPPSNWCKDPQSGQVVPCIQVVANPGNSALNAPGGQRSYVEPVTLIVGLQYASLRVCDGWLEQKVGIFNPATDDNCPGLAAGAAFPPYVIKAGWSPLLPNVEDLQFAYLFDAGTVGNGPAGAMTTAAHVPIMGGTPLDPWDIRRVIGIRVTVTARSSSPVFGGGKALMRQPAAEDHDPGAISPDTYFRYQLSSTSLLRNRDAGF
ncbi:MAG TPA: hypothetical protein PK435_07385 [Thermoanaerobaculaceae bacterium]|nr:hypothetical protein [Thermoanaerobaculaceae bacterium]